MYPNDPLSTRLTEPAHPPRGAGLLTALVADDFEAARSLFVDALDSSGRFSVVAEAANGREALEAVADHHPDLAVLDLAMPVLGGLDVIEEINEVSPGTRVVVVSGFPGRGLEDLVVVRGAAGYVRKRPSIRAVVEEIVLAAGALEIAEQVMATSRRFPRDERSPRDARRFVDEILRMWDCQPAIDTLELILSEVVSNAVVHARSAPEVSVRLLEGFLRVEVADDSDAMPEVRPADEMDTGGRGLQILASESTRWGIAPRPGGGKAVWFEVPIFGSG
jgi:DNA-binding NarL/FixJ family response regulator